MEFNRWWNANQSERYWLEITTREDLGVDLSAPQLRDDGREYYGYSLMREVRDEDIIFHYHVDKRAIVGFSSASGGIMEDSVVWGVHGTTTTGESSQQYIRPGWRLNLRDFQQLVSPVSLHQIQTLESEIHEIYNRLKGQFGPHLYFPFEISNKRSLRPSQSYLSKLPNDIVSLISSSENTGLVLPDTGLKIAHLTLNLKIIRMLLEGRIQLDTLHWREFEELVAELLILDGYIVELGPGQKDGGKDIAAIKELDGLGLLLSIWQAKKLRPGRKVSVNIIRELADTTREQSASKGIVVTSTFLTNEALQRVNKDKYILGKVDRNDLMKWLERVLQKPRK